jgi:hypothetical protein
MRAAILHYNKKMRFLIYFGIKFKYFFNFGAHGLQVWNRGYHKRRNAQAKFYSQWNFDMPGDCQLTNYKRVDF